MFIGNLHRSNVLVVFSLFFGAVGIGFAILNQTQYALISLIISTIADAFIYKFNNAFERDEAEASFSIELERLTDFVIFGLLPAVLLIQVLQAHVVGVLIAALYMLATAIRLAHFNRSSRFLEEVPAGFTIGVPLELIGIVLPVISLFGYILPLIAVQVLFGLLFAAFSIGFVINRLVPKVPSEWTLYIFGVQAVVAGVLMWLGSIL